MVQEGVSIICYFLSIHIFFFHVEHISFNRLTMVLLFPISYMCISEEKRRRAESRKKELCKFYTKTGTNGDNDVFRSHFDFDPLTHFTRFTSQGNATREISAHLFTTSPRFPTANSSCREGAASRQMSVHFATRQMCVPSSSRAFVWMLNALIRTCMVSI